MADDRRQLKTGDRVCGYVRDSGGVDQELSTDQQERRIKEFCKERGYFLTQVFRDAAGSGRSTAGRDAFLEMIDYLTADAQEVGVIFWSYSRFSRDYDDTQFYLAHIRQAGKSAVSSTDDIPDTLDERILESLIAWQNAKFRQDLSRDVKRGLRYVVEKYRAHPSGHTPVGLRRVPIDAEAENIPPKSDGTPRKLSRLAPDPETGPLVRRAFEMRGQGATLLEILKELPSIAATKGSLSQVLKNRIYIGTLDYGGQEYKDFCEPLLDIETWDNAQAVNKERSDRLGYNHPRRVRSRYLLTGLIKCARCESSMHGAFSKSSTGRLSYDYYRCGSGTSGLSCGAVRIPKDKVERLVINLLLEHLLQPEYLSDFEKRIQSELEREDRIRQEQKRQVQSELASLSNRINNLIEAVAVHSYSTRMLEMLAGLEDQHRELQVQVAELESLPRKSRVATRLDLYTDDLTAFGTLAADALQSADPKLKREMMRSLIQRIRAEKIDDEIKVWVESHLLPGEVLEGSS